MRAPRWTPRWTRLWTRLWTWLRGRGAAEGPPRPPRWTWLVFGLVGTVWVMWRWYGPLAIGETAQVGARYDALNALFSGLALAAFAMALYMQASELKLQRETLRAQGTELKLQRKALDAQAKTLAMSARLNARSHLIAAHAEVIRQGVVEDIEDAKKKFPKLTKELAELLEEIEKPGDS